MTDFPTIPGKRLPEAEATARRLRRFRRVRAQLIADRGNDPTQAQEILADNAAALAIRLEAEVAKMMQGRMVDVGELNTSMNTLRRLLETLGIERQPRDITTLSEYLAKRQQPAAINGSLAHSGASPQ
jgi:hypothetical protein